MPATGPDLAATPADEAVPRLLEEHGNKLYQLGLKVCGRPADAEDLVQETFLQAFRRWDQFEGRAEPSTWLYTIATRACWRRRRPRAGEPKRMESLSDLPPGRAEPAAEHGERPAGPLEDQIGRETRAAVNRAIAALPLPYRLPLVLKEIAELSVAQVAAILELKPATVKTRVHRARLRLRESLEAAGGGWHGGQPLRRGGAGDGRSAEAGDGRSTEAGDGRSTEAGDGRRTEAAEADGEHPREICLDLLAAKQEALDKGHELPLADQELCARCARVFAQLDLAHEACAALARGELPAAVRRLVMDRIAAAGTDGGDA